MRAGASQLLSKLARIAGPGVRQPTLVTFFQPPNTSSSEDSTTCEEGGGKGGEMRRR